MRSENQARNSPRRAAPAKQSRTRKRCLNSRRPGSSSTSAGVSMLRDNSCETLTYRPFQIRYASQGRRTIRSVVACSNEKNNAALDRQTAVLDRASLIVRSTTPEIYAPWGNDDWEMTSGLPSTLGMFEHGWFDTCRRSCICPFLGTLFRVTGVMAWLVIWKAVSCCAASHRSESIRLGE